MTKSVKSALELRIEELEQFLKDIDEIRKEPNHMLSPIAGMLEKEELRGLKRIWENTVH